MWSAQNDLSDRSVPNGPIAPNGLTDQSGPNGQSVQPSNGSAHALAVATR